MEEKHSVFSIPQTTIDWLLESQTPSIRYYTYKNLLNRPDDDAMVRSTRAQIAESDYVRAITTDQDPEGFWYNQKHYYGPKYRSSHWVMLLLTELGVPPQLSALQRGADFMVRRMEDEDDVYYSVSTYQNKSQSGFCCYWGNWLRYQVYSGRIDHPLVQQVIEIVSADILHKGKCEYNYHLPCAWGVIRSLFGLALIPNEHRTELVNHAIAEGIAFILDDFNLIKANYPNRDKVHPIWYKLSFPLYYQADILFTLRVLSELNALKQANAQEALQWLEDKQKKDGTWRGSSPFKNRSHPFLSRTDTPGRWVTLHALSVLAAANK